jgi:hypothetical protein
MGIFCWGVVIFHSVNSVMQPPRWCSIDVYRWHGSRSGKKNTTMWGLWSTRTPIPTFCTVVVWPRVSQIMNKPCDVTLRHDMFEASALFKCQVSEAEITTPLTWAKTPHTLGIGMSAIVGNCRHVIHSSFSCCFCCDDMSSVLCLWRLYDWMPTKFNAISFCTFATTCLRALPI